MKERATPGLVWRETHRPGPPWMDIERTIWAAVVPGMFYPDQTPLELHAELGPDGDKWFVSDNNGALRSSPAPHGVIGTLMGRTEGFFDVEMTGDGHLYTTVPHLPARCRWERIEKAAIRVAAYSLFMAWAGPPTWWPPEIVITMTAEQAIQHGLYFPAGQRAAPQKKMTTRKARPRG